MAILTRRNEDPHALVITGQDIVTTAVDPDGQEYDELVSNWRARGEGPVVLGRQRRPQPARRHRLHRLLRQSRPRGRSRRRGSRNPAPRGAQRDSHAGDGTATAANGSIEGHVREHEVGYWLVPGGAQVLVGSTSVPTPTSDQIAESLNRGNGVPPFPIIGPGGLALEPVHRLAQLPDVPDEMGINRSPPQPLLEQLYGRAQAVGADVGRHRRYTRLPAGRTRHRYSDLELVLMGLLAPPAFSPADARMNSLRPQWVYPATFQAGLYVECGTA
jgi:hypothetical protein